VDAVAALILRAADSRENELVAAGTDVLLALKLFEVLAEIFDQLEAGANAERVSSLSV